MHIPQIQGLRDGVPRYAPDWVVLEIGVFSLDRDLDEAADSGRFQYSYVLGYAAETKEPFLGFVEDIQWDDSRHTLRSLVYAGCAEKEGIKELSEFCTHLQCAAPLVFRAPFGRVVHVSVDHLSFSALCMREELLQEAECWWLEEMAPSFAPVN